MKTYLDVKKLPYLKDTGVEFTVLSQTERQAHIEVDMEQPFIVNNLIYAGVFFGHDSLQKALLNPVKETA